MTEQLAPEALANCPFCGFVAREFQWRGHVGCSNVNCGAHAANITVEQWNRRAPAREEWTQTDRLFISSRLLARARHESKKLLNVERNQKTLHPELLKQIHEDIAECTRIALKLQGGANG